MSRPAPTDSEQLQQLPSAKRGKADQNPQHPRNKLPEEKGGSH
jgi:hypothetical protein